jgi:hypothetical protein
MAAQLKLISPEEEAWLEERRSQANMERLIKFIEDYEPIARSGPGSSRKEAPVELPYLGEHY